MSYAVVTWEVGDVADADDILREAEECLDGRETCVLLEGVRITTVSSGTDFLRLAACLEAVGDDSGDAFTWSAHLLRKNAATRTNGDADEECVERVVEN